MTGFMIGADRGQGTMFPERLEDYVTEDNPVRVIDFFVDQLDLAQLGFSGVNPKMTDRPAYHPAMMRKLYIYGYLNRVQSSRRLERQNLVSAFFGIATVCEHRPALDSKCKYAPRTFKLPHKIRFEVRDA